MSGQSNLNYQQRIQASILFGEPLDASMQPQTLKMIQESKAQTEEESQKASPPPQGGSAQVSKSLETESTMIEKGVD
jgi:hypothetical protein